MRKIISFIFLCCLIILLVSCTSQKPATQTLTTNQTKPMEKLLNLKVSGYEDKRRMPVKYATKGGGGENISIGLKWQPLPAAQSYALLFDDKHPVANGWVHWLVVDIPLDVNEIAEGASRIKMPTGSKELTTSWKKTGYDGPQPPVGSGDHEYVATLYALDIPKLSLTENDSVSEFLKAIEGHVITQESWSGYFERK